MQVRRDDERPIELDGEGQRVIKTYEMEFDVEGQKASQVYL